jgi:lipid A 4'-phosphatase
VLAVLPVIAIAVKLTWPRMRMLMRPRAAILLITTMLIGPGLLVNGILKEQWSRPRPGEVVEVGGPLAFKPWYDPSGECRSNCSFVSGESASAFWLLAPATLVPAPWTVPAVCATTAYAAVVAFTRVFTTGHFVTDAVFAAMLVSLVVWLMHGLLYRWKATAPSDETIERWMERCVRAVWSPVIAAGARLVRRDKNLDADR